MVLVVRSTVAQGQVRADGKAECEGLMNQAILFAQKMLRKQGGFYPYAYVLNSSGKVALVGGYDGKEHPESQAIIDLLIGAFQKDAQAGTIRATALVYDVKVVAPGTTVKSDAIAVALEHRDGYSVAVYFPYVLGAGEVTIGKSFAERSKARVFAPRSLK
jgi:hypothetical protein